jgi:hypothetical protein
MSDVRTSLGVDASGAETFELKDDKGNVIGYETVYPAE